MGPHGSLLHPFPQTELYFKQLEEGRREASRRGGTKEKVGALRVLSLERLCGTVNTISYISAGMAELIDASS